MDGIRGESITRTRLKHESIVTLSRASSATFKNLPLKCQGHHLNFTADLTGLATTRFL